MLAFAMDKKPCTDSQDRPTFTFKLQGATVLASYLCRLAAKEQGLFFVKSCNNAIILLPIDSQSSHKINKAWVSGASLNRNLRNKSGSHTG